MSNEDYINQFINRSVDTTDGSECFVMGGNGVQHIAVLTEEIRMFRQALLLMETNLASLNAVSERCAKREAELDELIARCRAMLDGMEPSETKSTLDPRLYTETFIKLGDVDAWMHGTDRGDDQMSKADADSGFSLECHFDLTDEDSSLDIGSLGIFNDFLGQDGIVGTDVPTERKWGIDVSEIKETGFVAEDQIADFLKSLSNVDKDVLYLMLYREGVRLDVHAMEKFRKRK